MIPHPAPAQPVLSQGNISMKFARVPQIPTGILSQHIAILGKTGAGKSSAMRVLVEELLDQQKPVCIIDPKGDWWGLKAAGHGRTTGYPVVIFGGEHGDVPLNAHAGASVAELIATGNRPCIIDLGGWMVGERTRFFIDFASTLFRTSKGLRWLAIDEVHNFAPQGKILDPDAGKMLHWANRLASEGRGKGLTIISASQRPQKVHKDFLTCAETLIAMRVIHNLDRDAVKAWVDGCADPQVGRDVLATLAGMDRGEGWVWSPEIKFGPERVKFPMFTTYDSFRPQVGESVTLKGWAEVDLAEVTAKLATVVEQAKANDPSELRRTIADLRKQLATRPTSAPVMAPAPKPLLTDAEMDKLESVCTDFRAAAMGAGDVAAKLAVWIDSVQSLHRDASAIIQALTASVHAPRPTRSAQVPRVPRVPIAQRASDDQPGIIGNNGLRRMMIALAQRPQGLDRRQLGVRAGLSCRSGTFGTYLGRGRSEGWIDGSGDHLRITDAGIASLGSYDPLPTGQNLLDYWLRELGQSGAARMLESLAKEYPAALTREELGEAAGISSASGTFGTYLGKLRALELVTGRGEIRAAEELFDD